jgi:hypothetical protein
MLFETIVSASACYHGIWYTFSKFPGIHYMIALSKKVRKIKGDLLIQMTA